MHAGDAPNVSLRFSGLAELGANNDLVLEAGSERRQCEPPCTSIDIHLRSDRHRVGRDADIDRDRERPRLSMNREGAVQFDGSRFDQAAACRLVRDGRKRLDLEEICCSQVGVPLLVLVSIDAASMMSVPLMPPSAVTVPVPSSTRNVPFAGNTHSALVRNSIEVRSRSSSQLPTKSLMLREF